MLVEYAKMAADEHGLAVMMAHDDNGKPSFMEVGGEVATQEAAKQFAAQFPKYMKMRGTTIGGLDSNRQWHERGWIVMRLHFTPNKVTGERNDAAIKRALKLFEIADKKNISLRCDDRHCRNAIIGRENMIAAIKSL